MELAETSDPTKYLFNVLRLLKMKICSRSKSDPVLNNFGSQHISEMPTASSAATMPPEDLKKT